MKVHQRVLHILAYATNEEDVADKDFFEKALRDVSFVSHEISKVFAVNFLPFWRLTLRLEIVSPKVVMNSTFICTFAIHIE